MLKIMERRRKSDFKVTLHIVKQKSATFKTAAPDFSS